MQLIRNAKKRLEQKTLNKELLSFVKGARGGGLLPPDIEVDTKK